MLLWLWLLLFFSLPKAIKNEVLFVILCSLICIFSTRSTYKHLQTYILNFYYFITMLFWSASIPDNQYSKIGIPFSLSYLANFFNKFISHRKKSMSKQQRIVKFCKIRDYRKIELNFIYSYHTIALHLKISYSLSLFIAVTCKNVWTNNYLKSILILFFPRNPDILKTACSSLTEITIQTSKWQCSTSRR